MVSHLYSARISWDLEVVRLLLEFGANVNTLRSSGDAILRYAGQVSNMITIRILLQHSANANAKNAGGRTTRKLAVRRGWVDAEKMLIEW